MAKDDIIVREELELDEFRGVELDRRALTMLPATMRKWVRHAQDRSRSEMVCVGDLLDEVEFPTGALLGDRPKSARRKALRRGLEAAYAAIDRTARVQRVLDEEDPEGADALATTIAVTTTRDETFVSDDGNVWHEAAPPPAA